MVNKSTYSHEGMNQDVTKSKHPEKFYYSANNIRILSTNKESTFSVTNEQGNSLQIQIPSITIDSDDNTITYNDESLGYSQTSVMPEIEYQLFNGILPYTSSSQKIIGNTVTRDSIILFTTDDLGMDCIWEVNNILEDSYDITLLYVRNLNFSSKCPIQALFNYENEKIQKVYWVDGLNQLRFINIKHSTDNGDLEELIDLDSDIINIVSNYKITQPIVSNTILGGTHTAGMIQYAYNLYRLNSSQTKLSPLTELVALDKSTLGGGEVNEVVGCTPVIKMNGLDQSFTHIRLYAIKYTSYNQIPSISLILDAEIPSTGNITYYDNGGIIQEVSLEEFTFLGSEPVSPKHIESKDNRLFSANLRELPYDIEIDCRAYSFRQNQTSTYVLDNVIEISGSIGIPQPTPGIGGSILQVLNTYVVPKKHDSINPNYDTYKYQYNSSILGGEGKYIKYQLTSLNAVADELTFFKDKEIYRIGIQFYNSVGQFTPVKWIADFKAPEGNLEQNYNTLSVELKPEFYTYISTLSEPPVGYKIVRADRTINDMTIICQGGLNGMMSNTKETVGEHHDILDAVTKEKYKKGNILPSLQRVFDNSVFPMLAMEDGRKLDPHSSGNANPNGSPSPTGTANREVIKAASTHDWRSDTFQFNKIMQLFTPEALFTQVSPLPNMVLRIKGAAVSGENYFWGKQIKNTTLEVEQEGKTVGAISPHATSANNTTLDGSIGNLMDSGLFGPSRSESSMDFYQFYRNFTASFEPSSNSTEVNIYGTPEFTERGQGLTYYNNNPELPYYNSLQPMLTDKHTESDAGNSNAKSITSVNTYGTRCITLSLGNENTPFDNRITLEQLHSLSGISETNCVLIGEICMTNKQIYLSNIYGGFTYESKKRNEYIEIGNYSDITTATIDINSPGDTFVHSFKFLKLGKTDVEVHNVQSEQISEIVEYLVESTVDLKNRNDISLTNWDTRFQPRDSEYHKYNRVYSQQATIIENSADFNEKEINDYDTKIISSKLKTPGERIDSWTDFLVNEEMDLDGKYGPINALVNFNDNIYALQDEGIAAISINPRIQVQGSDGVSVELGTGSVLYDYNYLTTKSGTINKWSVISTNSGFYYYDALNKSWNRFSRGLEKLTDMYGLHTFFENNSDYDLIKVDNPLTTGVSTGYYKVTHDVFLTLHQGNKSFTLAFNEMSNTFTSFYDYKPSFYITKGFSLITTNPSNNQLWQHFTGDYNSFYGGIYESNITYLVNPQYPDCIFNNVEYKSEVYLNNIDRPTRTLTHIELWNEYLSTQRTELVLNSNLNRKFRMWRATIPRVYTGTPTLDRMRGNWVFLKLSFENTNNYKLILHDMNVMYSAYN